MASLLDSYEGGARRLLPALGVVMATAACGDSFVSTGGTAGGTTGTSAAGTGGVSNGGTGGVPNGGSGGASNGGTGGVPTTTAVTGGGGAVACTPGTPGACDAGSFCAVATSTCTLCSDLSSLGFGAAEKLDGPNILGASQRFPRATHNDLELIFRATPNATSETRLYWMPDWTQAGGGELTGVPLPGKESGPLEALGIDDASPLKGNFFYDVATIAPNRALRMANRSGGSVTDVLPVPAPFNGVGSADFSLAIAPEASRAWWMTTRFGLPDFEPVLVTLGIVADTTMPAPVVLKVPPINCNRLGADATPWVTRDGKIMVFRAIELDLTCQVVADAHDLYLVRLEPNGLPSGTATRLDSASVLGRDDTDPSLSPDLCWLYFSAGAGEGEYDLFRAPRQ
jgi:hypothetical protein